MSIIPALVLELVEKHWEVVAATGAGVAAAKRWIVPHVKEANATMTQIAKLPEKVESLSTKIDAVSDSVKGMQYLVTNNGKTGLVQMVATLAAQQRLANRNDATWQANSSGQNIRIGIGFAELLGWKSEDMVGDGWLRMLSPESREDYLQAWENAVEQHVPFVYPREGTVRLRCADGTWINASVTAMPTQHEIDGEVNWVGVIEQPLPCVADPINPLCGRKVDGR